MQKKTMTLWTLLLLTATFLLTVFSCDNSKENKITPSILDFKQIENIEQNAPYILDLTCDKKHLIVYGTNHTFDPRDTIFFDIEKKFNNLKPTLSLNEGGDWEIFSTKDSTIQESGEAGFLRFISKQGAIQCFSFEPPLKEEIKYIVSKYSSKEVLLMYVCRQTVQIQKQYESLNDTLIFYKSIENYFQKLKASGLSISDTKKTLLELKVLYKEMFNEEFNWKSFDAEKVYPNEYKTKLNEINREVSNFRDKYIVEIINNELKKHDKLFVLIGATHVYKQEPLIKYYFDKACNSN